MIDEGYSSDCNKNTKNYYAGEWEYIEGVPTPLE